MSVCQLSNRLSAPRTAIKRSGQLPKRQNGFTVVELLIAGVLGIILITGVIQLFAGSKQSYTMQQELATVQENGRYAMQLLEAQFQRAGWRGAEGATGAPASAIDLGTSSDGGNDSVTATYMTNIDGVDNKDCSGVLVADGFVQNQFSVNANKQLVCAGGGGSSPALILMENVVGFQVLYGVDSNALCPDGIVNSYLTKADVEAAELANNILSIRVAVLLESRQNIKNKKSLDNFQVLDQSVSFNDRILRRLFQETISMPNAGFNTLVRDAVSQLDCTISKAS